MTDERVEEVVVKTSEPSDKEKFKQAQDLAAAERQEEGEKKAIRMAEKNTKERQKATLSTLKKLDEAVLADWLSGRSASKQCVSISVIVNEIDGPVTVQRVANAMGFPVHTINRRLNGMRAVEKNYLVGQGLEL